VSSGIVADPRDVQARNNVHAHCGDEETGVSAADVVDSDLDAVADDDAYEGPGEERASKLVVVAETTDDQEYDGGKDVYGDCEELGVDVAVSHASDDGRPDVSRVTGQNGIYSHEG